MTLMRVYGVSRRMVFVICAVALLACVGIAIGIAGHAAAASTSTIGTSSPFDVPINLSSGSVNVNGSVGPGNGLSVTVGTQFGTTTLADPACNLTVIKVVQGGTAVPSNFEIHVTKNGTDINHSPQPGSVLGTTYQNIDAGTYSVSETGGPAGYTPHFSGDCTANGTVSLPAGGSKMCTITNVFTGGGGTSTSSSQGGGSLTGQVISTSSSSTGTISGTVVGGGSLTGTVATLPGGGSLSGSVVSPPGGGGLTGTVTTPGGGGGGGGGGSNGPPVSGGGGGSTPPPPGVPNTGGTTTPISTTSPETITPGVPNTGAGGDAANTVMMLWLSAYGAIAGFLVMRLSRR